MTALLSLLLLGASGLTVLTVDRPTDDGYPGSLSWALEKASGEKGPVAIELSTDVNLNGNTFRFYERDAGRVNLFFNGYRLSGGFVVKLREGKATRTVTGSTGPEFSDCWRETYGTSLNPALPPGEAVLRPAPGLFDF